MDNKLSELSKPVAWTDERGNLCTNRNKERGLESRYHQDYEKYTTPFYSQEYVSALKQRIDELEAVKADASQVLKEIGNELGCNPDNESIMMAIDDLKATQMTGPLKDVLKRNIELEAKLATPVRLTDERTLWAGEDDYDTGHVKGWNANRIEQAALLKKQGFTVEGDE